jgi:hypothetical protein
LLAALGVACKLWQRSSTARLSHGVWQKLRNEIPDVWGATIPTLRVFWKGQRKSVIWIVSRKRTLLQGSRNEPFEG